MLRRRFENMRPRTAVIVIFVSTTLVVILCAVLAYLLARKDFGGFGVALWWSLQTVTTVGYGDVVPATTYGRLIAAIVMLFGIAATSVLTAFVTSALFEVALRRHRQFDERALMKRLDAIDERLASIAGSLPRDPG
jgi:voltage-gated potassium channel